VFVPGKSPVRVQPNILDICLGELQHVGARCVFGPGEGARLFSCGECDVDKLGSVSFHFSFLNQFWIATRLVCSFFEAMAG
jgi:hypothetical protein